MYVATHAVRIKAKGSLTSTTKVFSYIWWRTRLEIIYEKTIPLTPSTCNVKAPLLHVAFLSIRKESTAIGKYNIYGVWCGQPKSHTKKSQAVVTPKMSQNVTKYHRVVTFCARKNHFLSKKSWMHGIIIVLYVAILHTGWKLFILSLWNIIRVVIAPPLISHHESDGRW